MRTIDVFFYGLFMSEELLRSKGISSPNLRPASVSGFQLRIGARATLVPDRAGRVFGMIATLTHAELESLYSEPGLQAYKPEAVLAHLSQGEALAALCFNLPEIPPAEEQNAEYAARLRSLAGQLGFPEKYVRSIQ